MTRTLAHKIPVEIAWLGLFELVLSFMIVQLVMTTPGALAILANASPEVARNGTFLAAYVTVIMISVAVVIGLYRPEVCLESRHLIRYLVAAGLCAFPLLMLGAGALSLGFTPLEAMGLASILAIWLVAIFLSRVAFRKLAGRSWLVRRILIVGRGDRTMRLANRLQAEPGQLFDVRVVDPSRADPAMSDLREQRIWGVITVGDGQAAHPVGADIKGIRVFNEASFAEQQLGRVEPDLLDPDWMQAAQARRSGALARVGKRAFDVTIGLVLVVLTLPVMLITAILIKLDSPGPVLYRQTRSGLGGQSFMLFKFRSMAVDAEAGGHARWAQARDPRITRVGSLIRPLRIDELPQLLNVLRGEMSLIGPRPERPVFVEQLSRVIPHYQERSCVKPGITGWAQVNFPYGASVEDAREKLTFDLYYVKNRSFLMDCFILLSTVRVILFREGAR